MFLDIALDRPTLSVAFLLARLQRAKEIVNIPPAAVLEAVLLAGIVRVLTIMRYVAYRYVCNSHSVS